MDSLNPSNETEGGLRALPAVERLAAHPALADLPHAVAVRAARATIADARTAIRAGTPPPALDTLAARAAMLAEEATRPTLRRAINATGVLLHTNLGRATLAPAAACAVADVARGHASLEVDEDSGGRGSRQSHVTALLCELTGAEDAFVVNNNAAATFLAINALAAGREVILSRGQMVEIGGQFRLPDVIASAGATLVEVGTTNRTRISDYERAITERTAILLRVHPSNYRIVGFTEEASLADLVALGAQANIPVGDDIGSGALVDFAPYGLIGEPTAPASIAAGADIVWFSGDKLLGGPQAGILVGRKERIAPMKRHPLARALRPDKLTLAALEATLRLYQSGRAWDEIPFLHRIARSADDVKESCRRVATAAVATESFSAAVVPTASEIGGGSLPGHTIPSWAVMLVHVSLHSPDLSADALARVLRKRSTPIYGRIEHDCFRLDLRAVDADEEAEIITALQEIAA